MWKWCHTIGRPICNNRCQNTVQANTNVCTMMTWGCIPHEMRTGNVYAFRGISWWMLPSKLFAECSYSGQNWHTRQVWSWFRDYYYYYNYYYCVPVCVFMRVVAGVRNKWGGGSSLSLRIIYADQCAHRRFRRRVPARVLSAKWNVSRFPYTKTSTWTKTHTHSHMAHTTHGGWIDGWWANHRSRQGAYWLWARALPTERSYRMPTERISGIRWIMGLGFDIHTWNIWNWWDCMQKFNVEFVFLEMSFNGNSLKQKNMTNG